MKATSWSDKWFTSWNLFVTIVSFEWLLTLTRRPNGGSIILLRALLTAIFVFILVLGLINLLDPTKTWPSDFRELRIMLNEKIPWFGAIFASIYIALYARFASQWTYLANLYNSIKETEARVASDRKAAPIIADWKAGFLEDAENLHLATKGTFVAVLKIWGEDKTVRSAFIRNTPGNERRFTDLMDVVRKVYEICENKHLASVSRPTARGWAIMTFVLGVIVGTAFWGLLSYLRQ